MLKNRKVCVGNLGFLTIISIYRKIKSNNIFKIFFI